MSTTVTYKGATLTTVENQTRTLLTSGKYLEDDLTLVDISRGEPSLQAKTNIAPTTSSQTITPDSGYDGLSSVQINAMPTGAAGIPIATKGTVSNHAVSVTPSVTNTTGYITGGSKTGTAVSVAASELVSGTKSITENGTGIDVTNYASVDVNVGGGGGNTVTIYLFNNFGLCDTVYYPSNATWTGFEYNPDTGNVVGTLVIPENSLFALKLLTSMATSPVTTNVTVTNLTFGARAQASMDICYVGTQNGTVDIQ